MFIAFTRIGTCGEKLDLCQYRCTVRLEAYAHGIKMQQFTHVASSQRKPCDVHVPTSTEPIVFISGFFYLQAREI